MSSCSQNSPANLAIRNAPSEFIKFIIDHNEKLLKDEVIASEEKQVKHITKTIMIYSRELHRRKFRLCMEEIKYISHFNSLKRGWVLKWLEAINVNDIEPYESNEFRARPKRIIRIRNGKVEEVPDSFIEEVLDYNHRLLADGTVADDSEEMQQLKRNIMIFSREQHIRKFSLCLSEMACLFEFKQTGRYWVLRWLKRINLNNIIPFNEPWTLPDLNGSVSRKRPFEKN